MSSNIKERERFIKFIEDLCDKYNVVWEEVDPEVAYYWNDFKNGKIGGKAGLTDNGKILMRYFQAHDSAYTAKEIAEDLMLNSRSVSGAMRSLVNAGFVEKVEEKPNKYQVTQEGLDLVIE